MTAKTMAEVLAEHRDIAWDHTTGRSLCGGCDATLGQLTADIEKQDAWLIAHQAAALSAAGFGLVTDAKAEAKTVQELDALWLGSVVISQGVSYQRYGNNEWAAEGAWYETAQVELPATILHDPRPAHLRNPS